MRRLVGGRILRLLAGVKIGRLGWFSSLTFVSQIA
jgi:hypothetical protein